jgi:2-methylisocitrate lyase-like PEP mutase family enzyme
VLVDDDRARARVRAAIDARGESDLVIVARSYAAEAERAWDRLASFAELGADVLFPVRHGYEAILAGAGRLSRPLYAVDRRNLLPPPELAAAGVRCVMDNDVFQISAKLIRDLLVELRREGFIAGAEGRSLSWEQFHEIMGTPAATRLAVAYGMLSGNER